MTDITAALLLITPEIQKLVDNKFAELEGSPSPDSALSQVNLLGGDLSVFGFIEHTEFGLAFDHLQYMVTETGIDLSPRLQAALVEILKALNY